MKILLANSPSIVPLEDGREKFFVKAGSRWPFSIIKERQEPLSDYIPFPFYLAYTASLLIDAGFEVETIDAVALNWDEDKFINHVTDINPDILLIESTTPTFAVDSKVIEKIKEKIKVISCLSGSHATSFADDVLSTYSTIDYIFRGEYEFHFLEFCKILQSNELDKLKTIKSIAFKDENNVIHKGEKGLIKELDELPYPHWEGFPQKGLFTWDYYWDNICQNKPAAQMHSSRGCPFRCDFCVWIQVMYDDSNHRSFSPKRIVDEMLELKKRFNIKEVYFDDDIFTGSKKHINGFCEEMITRNVNIKWSAMGDAMACTPKDAELMAKAGLIGYKFGVESGDERVLKEIQKPVKLQKVYDLCKTLNSYGVKTHATFSFGLSGETKESMQNTLNFMKRLHVDTLQVSIATPFPGTRFYDKVKNNGQITNLKWDDFDGANTSVVSNDNLTNVEIQEFAKFALKDWLISRLFRPNWVARQTKMMLSIAVNQSFKDFFRVVRAGLRILKS